MQSISRQVNRHPTKKIYIGHGDEAIFNTLRLMKKIITESAGNYYVRRWAEKIVENYKDKLNQVKAVFNFVATSMSYLHDPQGLEMLKSPLVSLQLLEIGEKPLGDCDDLTILTLSLLKSIGFYTKIKAVSTKSNKRFNHVYGQTKINNKWINLDLTRPEYGFGWEFKKATRIAEVII